MIGNVKLPCLLFVFLNSTECEEMKKELERKERELDNKNQEKVNKIRFSVIICAFTLVRIYMNGSYLVPVL